MKIGERYKPETFKNHEKDFYDSYVKVPNGESSVIAYTNNDSTGILYQYHLGYNTVHTLCFKTYML